MSNPHATQVFNSCDPLVDSGDTVQIRIQQTLIRAEPGGGETKLLDVTEPDAVHIRIEGPQTSLLATDIVGVYPAPGSDDSPGDFLPHIALTRRTLPWERKGPEAGCPWLALVLLKDSELVQVSGVTKPIHSTTVGAVQASHPTAYAQFKKTGLPDDTGIDIVYVAMAIAASLLKPENLKLLCHVRRAAQDNPLAKIDDDRDLAVVVSGRLPDTVGEKLELHHAYLVSLENRSDVVAATDRATPLIVLHYWTFTPSTGGDFEGVIQAIRVRDNGGVLRFGNLPRARRSGEPELTGGFPAMLDDGGYLLPPALLHQQTPAEYRGPLRPFEPGPRSAGFAVRPAPEEFDGAPSDAPPDYSYATAFEIGRLATLAGAGLVEDVQRIRVLLNAPEFDVPVLMDQMPDALRRPDWVVNPQWWADPYALPAGETLLKNTAQLLQLGQADFTGIAAQSAPWKASVVKQIEQIAGIEQQQSTGPIDVGIIPGQTLHEMFADVVAMTKAG
jgi:hypothetical protein